MSPLHKLYSRVDNLISKNSFPRTSLIKGEFGCGKHTLVEYIATRLSIEVVNITDSINSDTLTDMMLSPTPTIYLIEADTIRLNEQNALLKSLEEPLRNSYLILVCEDSSILLPTVVNRCVSFEFDPYSNEELLSSLDMKSVDELPMYAHTPGQVKLLLNQPMNEMWQYCDKIMVKIAFANCSNVLSIIPKIGFNKEPDRFDVDVLIYVLVNVAFELYVSSNISYEAYILTTQLYKNMKIPHINKLYVFENYLFRLKDLMEKHVSTRSQI